MKYHFHTDQGVEHITGEEAERIAGADADFHRRDLFDAIERGDHPSWTMSVQVMPYEDAKNYRYNPFDLTKIWPHADYPLIRVGTMTLNENPENFFAQIDQAAFAPSQHRARHRLLPRQDAARPRLRLRRRPPCRIGTNFDQLPVNQPLNGAANRYAFDGHMTYQHSGDAPVYAPNSFGRGYSDDEGPVAEGWEADGEMVRQAYVLHTEDDDWTQPGTSSATSSTTPPATASSTPSPAHSTVCATTSSSARSSTGATSMRRSASTSRPRFARPTMPPRYLAWRTACTPKRY